MSLASRRLIASSIKSREVQDLLPAVDEVDCFPYSLSIQTIECEKPPELCMRSTRSGSHVSIIQNAEACVEISYSLSI
jgi:hypothetical protein